jgi:type I restriction enzyme, S subunit
MKFDLLTIDDLGQLNRGRSRHRPRDEKSLYGGKYPFIQTGDVKHAPFYITNYTQTYNEKGLAQSRLWKKGTLCITIAANIADTAILGFDACFPDSILGFVPYKNKSNVRLVKYCFDVYKSTLEAISRGTTQDNLSLDKLRKVKFRIPLFPLQRKIAAVLSAYDDLIENNNRRIAILEKVAEELYREWFVRMRFPGHEKVKIAKGVPEGWEIEKIGSLGRVVTGKTPPTSNQSFFDGEYPFIKTPDMHKSMFIDPTEETISETGFKYQKAQAIPEKSICVSCIGTGGIVAITTKTSQTNQQINTIILENKHHLEWAYYTLRGMKGLIELFGYTGSTMTNLSKGKFENLKFVYPEDHLILMFHLKVEDIFKKLLMQLKQNTNLSISRDRLLSRLMSGKIDVEKLDIHFPASMQEEAMADA